MTLCPEVELDCVAGQEADYCLDLILHDPDGGRSVYENLPCKNAVREIEVASPRLWWPRGYGGQPLYRLEAVLKREGEEIQRLSQRIGLRKIGIQRRKDEYGESFAHEVNGIAVFAMGQTIFRRIISSEGSRRTLQEAAGELCGGKLQHYPCLGRRVLSGG